MLYDFFCLVITFSFFYFFFVMIMLQIFSFSSLLVRHFLTCFVDTFLLVVLPLLYTNDFLTTKEPDQDALF